MALYFLSYDLRKSRDYQKLYDELANFGALRMLESCWCFKRINTSASALRSHFKKVVDSDDSLVVSGVSDWATYNANKTPNEL